MLNVSDNSLDLKNEELQSYIEYFNKLGLPLVEEYVKPLDECVSKVRTYMSQVREYNVDFDVGSMQRIVLDLSSLIYFTQEQVEKIGLLDDLSKIKYKQKYNEAYLDKQSGARLEDRKYTAEQLRAIADNEAIEENLLNFIYSHAASVIKTKIEAAYEVLKASSKVLSSLMQAQQQSNLLNKYQ